MKSAKWNEAREKAWAAWWDLVAFDDEPGEDTHDPKFNFNGGWDAARTFYEPLLERALARLDSTPRGAFENEEARPVGLTEAEQNLVDRCARGVASTKEGIELRVLVNRLSARPTEPDPATILLCICGHDWDAHDGHTISVGEWPRTHCSQGDRCSAYYPASARRARG